MGGSTQPRRRELEKPPPVSAPCPREIHLGAQKIAADFWYLPYLGDSQSVKGEDSLSPFTFFMSL